MKISLALILIIHQNQQMPKKNSQKNILHWMKTVKYGQYSNTMKTLNSITIQGPLWYGKNSWYVFSRVFMCGTRLLVLSPCYSYIYPFSFFSILSFYVYSLYVKDTVLTEAGKKKIYYLVELSKSFLFIYFQLCFEILRENL